MGCHGRRLADICAILQAISGFLVRKMRGMFVKNSQNPQSKQTVCFFSVRRYNTRLRVKFMRTALPIVFCCYLFPIHG
jgi:hypothetical protein